MENVSRYRNDTGLLCEDRTTEVTSSDGAGVVQVKEHWEEKVPMGLKQKVSSRIIKVPVEVKTEMFDEHGNVIDEVVEVIPSDSIALRGKKDAVTLYDLQDELRMLAAKMSHYNASECCTNECNESSECNTVDAVKALDAKHGNEGESSHSLGMAIAKGFLWVGAAMLAAVALYQFFA